MTTHAPVPLYEWPDYPTPLMDPGRAGSQQDEKQAQNNPEPEPKILENVKRRSYEKLPKKQAEKRETIRPSAGVETS